nr:uncharacterized protein LOC104112896 [Nicotiana tomentosiformis]
MKDLGELKFFLGIEFARSKEEIVTCQRKYALELISKSGLGGEKPARTPLELNQKLTSEEYDKCIRSNEEHEDKLLKDPGGYQRLSKKQKAVSKSSTEAEFRSMASCTAEITWLIGLFKELGVDVELPVKLRCDSKAAIQIEANPIFHE